MGTYISVCFTTFDRSDLLFRATEYLLTDDRVDDIVISDDCSDITIFNQISEFYETHNKVKIHRNEKNQDCYFNKKTSVSFAKNEFVCLMDSDNIAKKNYIDSIYANPRDAKTILQPSFASPHFDFTKWSGDTIVKENVSQYMADPTFQTMLNACNYFVNRDEYLRVWDGSVDPVTSDSIYMAYRWLAAGNSIYVVPGMEYEHRVHEGSHYRNNVSRTPRGFHEDIVQRLKNMR